MSCYLVEFAGSPGSGKSSIAASLARYGFDIATPDDLTRTRKVNDQITWSKRFELLGCSIALVCVNPSLGWHLFRYWINSGPNWLRARQAMRLACWMYRMGTVRAHLAKTLVFDEGVIHLMADIPLPDNRKPDPARLVASALPKRLDAIVYVKCKPQVAFSRIRNRKPTRGRIDHLPDETAIPCHQSTADLVLQAVNAARNAGVAVLEVDASETAPQENARLIAAWLLDRGAQKKQL